jgi:hypothetical protein
MKRTISAVIVAAGLVLLAGGTASADGGHPAVNPGSTAVSTSTAISTSSSSASAVAVSAPTVNVSVAVSVPISNNNTNVNSNTNTNVAAAGALAASIGVVGDVPVGTAAPRDDHDRPIVIYIVNPPAPVAAPNANFCPPWQCIPAGAFHFPDTVVVAADEPCDCPAADVDQPAPDECPADGD